MAKKRNLSEKLAADAIVTEQLKKLLAKPYTKEIEKQVLRLLHDSWCYYIDYYLGKYKVYNKHDQYHEHFSTLYAKCIDMLPRLEKLGNEINIFNRIKRYYNVSISGLTYNMFCAPPVKQIDTVIDTNILNGIQDEQNHYITIDYDIDMLIVKAHMKKAIKDYTELYSVMYGADIALKRKKILIKRFTNALYAQYLNDGMLQKGSDYFNDKIGKLFSEK